MLHETNYNLLWLWNVRFANECPYRCVVLYVLQLRLKFAIHRSHRYIFWRTTRGGNMFWFYFELNMFGFNKICRRLLREKKADNSLHYSFFFRTKKQIDLHNNTYPADSSLLYYTVTATETKVIIAEQRTSRYLWMWASVLLSKGFMSWIEVCYWLVRWVFSCEYQRISTDAWSKKIHHLATFIKLLSLEILHAVYQILVFFSNRRRFHALRPMNKAQKHLHHVRCIKAIKTIGLELNT